MRDEDLYRLLNGQSETGGRKSILGGIREQNKLGKIQRQLEVMANIGQGQFGPVAEELLKTIGPRRLRDAVGDGRLHLNIDTKRPYVGFRYNFRK